MKVEYDGEGRKQGSEKREGEPAVQSSALSMALELGEEQGEEEEEENEREQNQLIQPGHLVRGERARLGFPVSSS